MRVFAVFPALLLAAALAPAAPGPGVLTDEDMAPHLKEFEERWQGVRSGKIKREQLVELYRSLAREEGGGKTRAVHTFIYAQILEGALQRTKDARKEYERALTIWPRFPGAHVALARLASQARDTKTFKRHIRLAREIDPEYPPALVHTGWTALWENRLDEAEELFKRSAETKLTYGACTGLARLNVVRYQRAYDEADKEKYAKLATNAANAWVTLDPNNGRAHIHRAQTLSDLGQVAKAIDSLESSYQSEIPAGAKQKCLENLLIFYRAINDVEMVGATLKRILELEDLKPEQREYYAKRLDDLKKMKGVAFNVWVIEKLLEILKHEGQSAETRQAALRKLLQIFDDGRMLTSPHLMELRWRIIKSAFRVLIDAPPLLTIEMMRFLRNLEDAHLIRILVHFVYPYEDEQRTPAVRVEAVRTLAAVGGEAALPALFYCLSDMRGEIMRAVDNELSRLCERRSPVGSGIKPLTDDEMQRCRDAWLRYARSDDGVKRLSGAFAKLGTVVERDPAHTRTLRSAPMVDHAVRLVLLDNDMPWPLWEAAYVFLLEYWGKDFRPPEERGTPVTPDQREDIVKEIDEFWSGADKEAEPEDPDAAAGEERGK